MKGQTLAFTGGGSGGHIYPGLAVIEALRKGFEGRMVWIGSTKEADRLAVETAGIEYFAIPSGKLRRQLTLANIADGFRVFTGYARARSLLKTLKPLLLFSKGGYVSVPPCAAAADLGIPVFTHESDFTPGLATRLNARRAERILVAYEATRESLPASLRERVTVTGNPLRAALLSGDAARGRALLGLPEGLPLILVLGGSQGAAQINELVVSALPYLLGRAFVLHQTGESKIEAVEKAAAPAALAHPGRYRCLSYLRGELPDLMAAASLIVSRAGAGGLWEAGALARPLILIPLAGAATRGDQVDNARHFEAQGAARVLIGSGANPAALVEAVEAWLDDPEAAKVAGAAARNIADPGAADRIAALILERIGERP